MALTRSSAANTQTLLKECIGNKEKFISVSINSSKEVSLVCQEYYGNSLLHGKYFGLERPKAALRQLYLKGLDHNQIWEQIKLNDDNLLSLTDDVLNLDCDNFFVKATEVNLHIESDASAMELFPDMPLHQSVATLGSNSKQGTTGDVSEDEGWDGGSGSDGTEQSESDDDDDDDDDDMADISRSSNSIDEGKAESDLEEEEEEEEEEEDEQKGEDTNDEDNEENDEEAKENEKDDDSSGNGSESDDSVYDALDKQLHDKYVNDFEDSDDNEEDGGIDDLALASGEDSDSDVGMENDGEEENEEDESESENGNEKKRRKTEKSLNSSKSNVLNKVFVPEFSKTSVDSGNFFNLRESEWIADEDIIGADNFDDIDFMEDIDDDNENAVFTDFFDNPHNAKSPTVASKENNHDDAPSDWGVGEDNTEEDKEDEKEATAVYEESQSRLECELQAEQKLRERLEATNISEKPWTLKGEVRATDRPNNSVLTEYLEYRSGARHKPEINDILNRRIEKLTIERIRTRTFDSVERKARLVEDAFEYKKKLVLDEEKSKKSLSKIYEEEYLKKQQSSTEAEELPIHREVRQEFDELEDMLNALSNAHYTPRMKRAEVKIVSNQPSLRIEEATPVVVGDGDVLAPQEILAPSRRELKGGTEMTETDKKHDRRVKKHKQHLKYKEINNKIDTKVKKAAREGKKLDVDTSSKMVQKAVKMGQVKLMDNQGAKTKSSTSFFKQLYETNVESSKAHAKKRKRDDKN